MAATSPEAETIIRQTDQINQRLAQSSSRIEQVQRSLDQAYAAQQRFQNAQNTINAALDRGRISQERANELLRLARERYQQGAESATRFAAANDNATARTRNFGGAIGQAGFQLQDFFVQVQGGTSALTALSQQGSQFLGVFGTGGAIAGAALAIGALVAALVFGRTEADRFKEAMERNRASYENATTAAERWRDGLRREAEQLQDLQGYYRSLNRERQQYELRQANRDAADVEARRAALQRDILGPLPGLSQGLQTQVRDAEMMAARNYGRGSAEFDAIMSDESIRRFRELIGVIEQFREVGDTSENAISALSARLRESADNAGPLRDYLLRVANEMERLGQRSRDVERDTREVNARLSALGAQAGEAAARVAALANELARVQREAQGAVGRENNEAIARAEERARALARGLGAAREFDARQAQTESADRYYREQQRADEARLRSARFTDEQIRDEIQRTDETRRASANRRAELEATNTRRLQELTDAESRARRGATQAMREENEQAKLTERTRRERDQLIASLDQEAAANLRLEESLRRIGEARRRNLLTENQEQDLRAEAIRRRDEEIRRLYDKSELDAEQIKRISGLTSDLGAVFRDTFSDAVREGKSFAEVLQNLEQRLLKLGDKYLLEPLLQSLAQLATNQLGGGGTGGGGLLGGILGTITGGGYTAQLAGDGIAKGAELIATAAVLHDGGIAGVDGPRRAVPASVFLDAPRYHSGGVAGGMPLANDEVPAVLKRGELVLTKEQQRASAGNRMTVNNYISTPSTAEFRKSGGQISADLARAVARGGRNR